MDNKMDLFKNQYLNTKFISSNISGIERYKTVYFSLAASKKVIQFCKNNTIGILGIDAFDIQGNYIVDTLDIYDASSPLPPTNYPWKLFVKESINGAIHFIAHFRDADKYFEFVFIEQDAYKLLADRDEETTPKTQLK